MDFVSPEVIEYITRIAVAALLGLIIGAERVYAQKRAGMRTYALVSMGAALFVVVSQVVVADFENLTNFDPMRTASQIVVGLGFIGAGIIIFHNAKVRGLTTAAGIWVAGGIGMSAGYGLYEIAVFATVLTLFIFTVLWFVEAWLKKLFYKLDHHDDDDEDI